MPGPDEARTRHIPAAIRRKVYERDRGRCQFRSPEGRPCHTTHALQLDHIHPYARGGPSSPENLRLLCGAHNRWREKLRP
jgi:5-methylcytosine-specific restriction endonuclease McrA